jgi:GNAT superfamily N-acetyltransferase
MGIEGTMFRDAANDDLIALLAIQKDAFARYTDLLLPEQIPPLNETLEDIRKDLKYKSIIAAYVDDSPAGSVRYYNKGGVCILERLSVAPALQGKGIGRGLITEIEKRVAAVAHKIYLETGLLASNLLMFYSKLGFSGEAILRRHYGEFDWIAFSKFMEKGASTFAERTKV